MVERRVKHTSGMLFSEIGLIVLDKCNAFLAVMGVVRSSDRTRMGLVIGPTIYVLPR